MLAYIRVYSDLLEKMKSGEYAIGTLLPPEPELEKIYGVSRTTVRRAISMLVTAKRVRVKQGHGTEVLGGRAPVENDLYRFSNITHVTEEMKHSVRPTHEPMVVDLAPAPAEVAEFLKVKPGSTVYRIHRRLHFPDDGRPFGYKINYVSPKLCPKIENYADVSINLYTLLYNQYKLVYDHADETITAVAADFYDSAVLGVSVGAPLLLLKRRSFHSGGPLEYTEFKIVPEYYEVTVHMEADEQSTKYVP